LRRGAALPAGLAHATNADLVLSHLAPICDGADGMNFLDHAVCMMPIAMRA
jgi:hypothetical protein